MKNIRIKKDILLQWTITTNNEDTSLENRDLTLYLITPYRTHLLLDFTVVDNHISTIFRGTEQKICGVYSLTLFENKDKEGQTVIDKVSAFRLVENTDKENNEIADNLQIETIDLGTSNLEIISSSNLEYGYTKEEIDEKLSEKVDNITLSNYVTISELDNRDYINQIKTINGQSLEGIGNIEIQGTGNGISDAPSDNIKYVRQNNNWVQETKVDTSLFATKDELQSKVDINENIIRYNNEGFVINDSKLIWDCGEY